MDEKKPVKTTFFSKKPLKCPICGASFHREDLLTGRGRLIAGNLTEEMRRIYEPSQKYGELYPLVYPINVCPSCYYATFPPDFSEPPAPTKKSIEGETDKRISAIRHIFEELDFTEPRALKEGVSSYFFAVMCYDHFPPENQPTFKRALSSLRAAWLFSDLHRKLPNDNYDYLSKLFYRKARFFYSRSIELEQTGKEALSGIAHFGPDLDQNYGYNGMLYTSGWLEYLYGAKGNAEKRKESLLNAKRTVSRIFGMGRASKDKPSIMLDKARDLFTKIGEELEDEEPDGQA